MRKPFVVGNWKMNKTAQEARQFVEQVTAKLGAINSVDFGVCPSFLSLSACVEGAKNSRLKIASQNISYADSGAYTGEISAQMLKEFEISYVLIGHSERRQYFGETNKTVNQRTKQAIANGLRAIVCIGETLQDREAGKEEQILKEQVTSALDGVSPKDMNQIILAYEPVWAIGTGVTATSQQAQQAHKFIRSLLISLYNEQVAQRVIIQYGGSVKPENIVQLLSCEDIDGALVGGASLEVASFVALVKNASSLKKD